MLVCVQLNLLPMESAIMGFSWFGVSFMPSTMALMGLSVLLAISDGFTSHLSRRLFALPGCELPFTRWTPFPWTSVPLMLLFLGGGLPWTPFPFIWTTYDLFSILELMRMVDSECWSIFDLTVVRDARSVTCFLLQRTVKFNKTIKTDSDKYSNAGIILPFWWYMQTSGI